MEKIFDDYKGIVLFYLLVAIIAILFTVRVDALNRSAQNDTGKIVETYYA